MREGGRGRARPPEPAGSAGVGTGTANPRPMRFSRLLTTVDAHCGGEPLRIITGGLPPLPGATILERRRYMRQHLDGVRRILMHEPRGHHGMYGAVLTPPCTPGADLGILFLHNEGYSTMCGHGVIAAVTVLLETGMLPRSGPEATVVLDSPAGTIRAVAAWDGERARSVRFENVPSFVLARDVPVPLPDGSAVAADVVYGGAFYAFIEAAAVGRRVCAPDLEHLQALQPAIRGYLEANLDVRHPLEPEIAGIYGAIFTQGERNVCIFADRQIDRSPCGTGTAARVAQRVARGELALGQGFRHESITGSVFVGRALRPAEVGSYAGVVPEVEGSAHITGFHQFVVDPEDPLREGFLLR
jgi:proline racemase